MGHQMVFKAWLINKLDTEACGSYIYQLDEKFDTM